jgi:4-hydroxybenzoyl-CoA reductase subunit beta
MSLPNFEVFIPTDLAEAVSFLSKNAASTKIIAGGTDLIPSMKQRLFEPQHLLDIKPLEELQGVQEIADGSVRIGALTTIESLARDPFIKKEFPVLQEAASTVAGPGLRNVGTIGGNICLDTRCYWYNQSYFWRQSCNFCIKKDGTLCHVAPGSKQCWAVYSGDTAAALLTLDAKIVLRSSAEEKILPLSEFFVNDGLIRNRMDPDQILASVVLPASARGYQGAYEKFRLRGSVDYPLAGIAVVSKKSNGDLLDLRISLTAVNPLPILLKNPMQYWAKGGSKNKAVFVEQVQKLAMRTAKPLKTSASTMDYRRHMLSVMVKRSLQRTGAL